MNSRSSAIRQEGATRAAGSSSANVSTGIVAGSAADHPAARLFLAEVFTGLSAHEFKASIEDPFHEPSDRLLFKQDGRIVGHVLTTGRTLRFGRLLLPIGFPRHLAISPELRGKGEGRRLLNAAEHHMAASGDWIGLLRTTIPAYFERAGWIRCDEAPAWQAPTRAVLSAMLESGLKPSRHQGHALRVRSWRRLELPALRRIHDQTQARASGALERTEAYWRWLLQRRAFDEIFVAISGPDPVEMDEIESAVVGYAVVRGPRILELHALPGRRGAAVELLARACGDAIEQDRHWLTLHAPARSRLNRLFQDAGGRPEPPGVDRGGPLLAKVLAPLRLLRCLSTHWPELAQRAGLPREFEVGLDVDQKRFSIRLGPQGAAVSSGRQSLDQIQLTEGAFTRLVLGQLDWPHATSARQVLVSTPFAHQVAATLFPPVPLWCPPWDDLPG